MSATQEATSTWQVDKVHSSANFEIKHSGVSSFQGSFGELDAGLEVDGDQVKLTGTVQVDSVQVENETLKGHLSSPDFFDVERYPELSFVSSDVVRGEGSQIELTGDLTLKGHTEPVRATGTLDYVEADISGNPRYGASLEAVIDRTKYGINWNADLPSGQKVLDDQVKLTVHLEFTPAA